MRAFLHIGAGKTGTSAIQVALASSRPQLAQAGIFYPRGLQGAGEQAERGEVSQGNAFGLSLLLNAKRRDRGVERDAAQNWLRNCIEKAAGRDLLFSSEAMQFPRPAETETLCSFLDAAGYEVTVILYVRHALDQAISAYLQFLKRGRIGNGDNANHHDRTAFLHHHRTAYLISLEPFAKVLPPERVIVRLYDKEQADLVRGFLSLISDRSFTIPAAEKVVNRSPTAAEQVVFTELARLPRGRFLCRAVSDLTLNRPSAIPAARTVSEAEFTDFATRNQPVVDAVNARFLKNNGELLIKSDRILVGDLPPPTPEEVYAAFAECYALLDADTRARLRAAQTTAIGKKPAREPASTGE